MAQTSAERQAKYRAGMSVEDRRAKGREAMRKWRNAKPENKAKQLAWNKKWRDANPEKSAVLNRAAMVRSRERNPARYLWHCAKARAKKFGIPFDLTVEDIVVPERCPVFNKPMKQRTGPWSPSLDRINPKGGYLKGNVAVICRRANQIKSDATRAEILRVARWLKSL
jgi:hypothetical protein